MSALTKIVVFLNNSVDFLGEKRRFPLLQIKVHVLAEELLVMTDWKQIGFPWIRNKDVHFINGLP